MRDVLILLVHLIVTLIRLARPGGIRAVVAESVFVKHQLVILNRSRNRAPNLRVSGWDHRRVMRTSHASRTRRPLCNCAQTIDSSSFPPHSGERKISATVFAKAEKQTRP